VYLYVENNKMNIDHLGTSRNRMIELKWHMLPSYQLH